MQMSRKLVVLSSILMIACCCGASAQQQKSVNFEREARVSIGADGKVTALAFVNWKATDDLVGKRLEPLIRSWTFQPAMINGQPVPTETTIHVQLEMSKAANGVYSIKLLDESSGPGVLKTPAPDYPTEELAANAEAKVTLLLAVDATGVPVDIKTTSVITNGSGASKLHFGKAAMDAAKHWRFQPESVGGHPVASHVSVPITFCLDETTPCSSIAKQLAAQASTPNSNTPTAQDSKVKLTKTVAGTTF